MIASRIGPEVRPEYQVTILITAVAVAALAGFLFTRFPRGTPEMKAEDVIARIAARPARADVVLVDLDQASVARYGAIKSWPRSVLATGLGDVETQGPKSVVLDLALDKRTRTGDAALWRIIANNRNVVLGMAFDANRQPPLTPDDIRSLVFLEKYAITGTMTFDKERTPVFPYYQFEPPVSDFTGSSRGVGAFLRETDNDGDLRSARLIYRSIVEYPASTAVLHGQFPTSELANQPVALPNLALVAALRSFDVDKESVVLHTGQYLALGGNLNPPVDVPIDEAGRMEIRYAGPAGTFSHVSFADLIDGKVPPTAFKDKTVIFGATDPTDPATDPKATAFGVMPRVEVTANALSTLLSRSYFGRYTPYSLATMMVIGLIVGFSLMFFSGWRGLLMGLLLAAVYFGVCWGVLAYSNAMMPVLPGFVTILATLLMALALYAGPFRPIELEASPTYAPPPEGAEH